MAYTYLIGWSNENIWYYGVRFAENAKPEDLWIKYFTSSKKVKNKRKELGEPDVIQIRKLFEDTTKARQWESKVIRRIRAISKKNWLNQTDNTDKFYHEGPRGPFTIEHREKLASAKRGRKISKEHAAKLHEGRRNSKNSPEHLKRLSECNKGKTIPKHVIEAGLAWRKANPERSKEISSKAGKASAAKKRQEVLGAN